MPEQAPEPAPLVSIIVTNHDYVEFLPRALEGAVGQSYPHVEVLVVDDGSKDASRLLLADRVDVTSILKPASGQTSAMNAGWRLSSGDLVIFLDADDEIDSGTVSHVVEACRAGGVAAVHWPLREADRNGALTGARHPRSPMPSGSLADRLVEYGPESYERPPTSGNAWSRAYLQAVMPLPEVERELGTGSAHADAFLADLAPLHGTVAILEVPGGVYRVHGANDYASKDAAARFARERWCFDERCRRLADQLAARGLPADVGRWRRSSWVHRVSQVFAHVEAALGSVDPFVMIDEDQLPALVSAARRQPFTADQGVYNGPPVDGPAAVGELEDHIVGGARGVVLAWPAFWWLDQYPEMHTFLEARCTRVVDTEDVKVWVSG